MRKPVLMALMFVACGESTQLSADDYDQSCVVDEDCVLIEVGDICCGCERAGINRSALDEYEDDRGTCTSECDIACAEVVTFCNGVVCDIRSP
jgi:hypothetical protein